MRHPPDPRPAWKAILAAGGNLPVSPIERARHQRVQGVLRQAFGLPEDAPEPVLIDAREGDHRSVRQMAAIYLRLYASRLNADDPTLDDVDRAALPWRDAHAPIPEVVHYAQPALLPARWTALLAGHIDPIDL